jgi:hypothetical protein
VPKVDENYERLPDAGPDFYPYQADVIVLAGIQPRPPVALSVETGRHAQEPCDSQPKHGYRFRVEVESVAYP